MTGGIGFIVPFVTTAAMIIGLLGAVFLTTGSYQLAAILSTTSGIINCIILVFQLLGFFFVALFGAGGDIILWLLLIKNTLCVTTESVAMVCAQNAGGALKSARGRQGSQQMRANQVMPAVDVPSHVPMGLPVTQVPVAQGVAVPAHVP